MSTYCLFTCPTATNVITSKYSIINNSKSTKYKINIKQKFNTFNESRSRDAPSVRGISTSLYATAKYVNSCGAQGLGKIITQQIGLRN